MTAEYERHLAAIMFTDIVGYTTLMQRDEAEARAVRARHMDVLEPSISARGGRLLQSFGDGTLSLFPSALEAVASAVEIQRTLGVYPKIPLRIGIHLGDIAYDEQGVYGDAVNIAARLEAIAATGSVLVSGTVAEELRNHTRFSTVSLGEVVLKNVERPIRVCVVAAEGIRVPERSELREGAAAPGPDEPSPPTTQAKRRGVDPKVIAEGTVPDPVALPSVFTRLKQRKLVQWALAYVAGGWLVFQLADLVAGPPGLSLALLLGLFAVLTTGFVVTLVHAWYRGEHGKQGASGPPPLAIAGLLGVGGFVLTFLGSGDDRTALAGPASLPTVVREQPAIAVLPFDNFSPDPDNAYFAAGMHEQVISELSKISGLLVISRNSVMDYAENRKSTTDIAAELGVDFVLEGSAQRDQDQVRLTTQLIDGRTDQHVWAEDYTRDLSVAGLFELQDEVADRVAAALSARILPDEAEEIGERPTESLVAYEYYLQGMAISDFFESENAYRAEAMFANAVEVDPSFTPAWAELAGVRAWLVWRHRDASRRLTADAALVRSVALDASDPRVQLAAGQFHLLVSGDLDVAQASLEGADRAKPNDPAVSFWLGVLRKFQGRFEEAASYYQRSLTLDPRNANAAGDAGHMYWELRRFEEAESSIRLAIILDPTLRVWQNLLFYFYLWGKGDTVLAGALRDDLLTSTDFDEPGWWAIDLAYLRRDYDLAAELLLERKPPAGSAESPGFGHVGWRLIAPELLRLAGDHEASQAYSDTLTAWVEGIGTAAPPSDFTSAMKHVTAGLGQAYRGEGEAAGRSATAASSVFPLTEDLFGRGPRVAVDAARIYVLADMPDRALEMLEQLLELPVGGAMNVNLLRLDPIWDPLREHPRYRALLDRYSQPN